MTTHSVTLRSVIAGDEAFLFDVYASTRTKELALFGWSTEQQTAFLAQQFHVQHQQYHAHYADDTFRVLLLDGQPVGRLYVARQPNELHIVDIALLPPYRNAGIGTQVLTQLRDEGARDGKLVRLHVEKSNPAQRLYLRLGFLVIADHGMYWSMEWVPPDTRNALVDAPCLGDS